MFRFSDHQTGQNRIGRAAAISQLASELGIPAHLTPEQAKGFALDDFRRCEEQELVTLEVGCQRE